MKRPLIFIFAVLFASSLWADDFTRELQQRLKDQGFYYGDVNGQPGDETSAAIRRYQIRYGLKVTGQVNDETLRSLGLSANGAAASPAPQRPLPPPQEQQPAPYREPDDEDYRQPPGRYDGQPFARPDDQEDYHEMRPPSFPAPRVAATFTQLFAGTIYEGAPDRVQQNVLYAVQGELLRRGFFRGEISGQPGPATTYAVAQMQEVEGLPVTGRLDNGTLDELQAFPGQRNGPPGRVRPWPGRPRGFFPYSYSP
ncbi:MAG TPA: peptidoglycan-binding domain-containing protein [Chthoniobacterales bacterium]|nr:peptidoglycan-binding domain-containing protein [Chthoniobacterales bacterium]